MHADWLNRIPAYTEAVARSDRPSILLMVSNNDRHPRLLVILDRDHITYRIARFPSQVGVDVVVVTPLNRSIPILESPQDFRDLFICSM